MSKLKFNLLLLIVLSFILIVGCSANNSENNSSSSNSENDTSSEIDTSSSESIEIQLGHTGNDTEDDPYKVYTDTFSEILEKETEGRISLKVFPNAQLGDLTSMMDQVNKGDLHMTAGQNTGTLATYSDNIQVIDTPYAFEDLDTAVNVLEGEFGQMLADDIADVSSLNIMSFIPSTFRHFGNNKHPIKKPEDMEGLTMRTMEIPAHQQMMKALGAIPQVVAFEETYSAMQTGVVDGHEQAPYTMLMANLEEVTKYFTLDKHTLNAAVSLVNQDFFNSLSDADQETILTAEREAIHALLENVKENEEQDMQDIEDAGVEIYELSSGEFQAFQDTVTGPVTDYLKKQVDPEVIDSLFEAIEKEEK